MTEAVAGSLRAAILAQTDLPHRDVYVKEWDVTVRVRMMTARERDEFEAQQLALGDASMTNLRARMVSLCVCDLQGVRLFGADDHDQLGNLGARPMELLSRAVMSLNRITNADMEELKKTSEIDP